MTAGNLDCYTFIPPTYLVRCLRLCYRFPQVRYRALPVTWTSVRLLRTVGGMLFCCALPVIREQFPPLRTCACLIPLPAGLPRFSTITAYQCSSCFRIACTRFLPPATVSNTTCRVFLPPYHCRRHFIVPYHCLPLITVTPGNTDLLTTIVVTTL